MEMTLTVMIVMFACIAALFLFLAGRWSANGEYGKAVVYCTVGLASLLVLWPLTVQHGRVLTVVDMCMAKMPFTASVEAKVALAENMYLSTAWASSGVLGQAKTICVERIRAQ